MGRENAFAKRVILTLAVIHSSGFPGEVFYYDFSTPSLVPPLQWVWASHNTQTIHSPCPVPSPHPPSPSPGELTLMARLGNNPHPGKESQATPSLVPRTHGGPQGPRHTHGVRSSPTCPHCAGHPLRLYHRRTQRVRKGISLVNKVCKGTRLTNKNIADI